MTNKQRDDRLITGSPAYFATAFNNPTEAMQKALAQQNSANLETAIAQLAGHGSGLTPTEDDYLLGLLYGLWATRPEDEVGDLANIVLETAVSCTTQISGAWLKTAAAGEAALPWHNLAEALLIGGDWERPFNNILNTGATSGIAALIDFVASVNR